MRTSSSFAAVLLALFATGCTTTSPNTASNTATDRSSAPPHSKNSNSSANAAATARSEAESDDGPSELKPSADQTPAEVRAIEVQIDRRAVIMADEIRIEVSKNYEWDVSLTGDVVTPHAPSGTGQESAAVGAARATVRNLDLRGASKITFWKSGYDVRPFIRITARGNVSHVESTNAAPRIRHAKLCAIRNAKLYFDDELLLAGNETPAATDGR